MKPEFGAKLPDWVTKVNRKIQSSIKGINLSERQKKIISTAFVAAVVCGFYLWIGIGLGKYLPATSKNNLSSLLTMYAVFPFFVLVFSVKRIVNILLGKEDREVIEPVKEFVPQDSALSEKEESLK